MGRVLNGNGLSQVLHHEEQVPGVTRGGFELRERHIKVACCLVLGMNEKPANADLLTQPSNSEAGVAQHRNAQPLTLQRHSDAHSRQDDDRDRMPSDAPGGALGRVLRIYSAR